MSRSTPIVFFGTDQFSHPSLTSLIAASQNMVAVVTKPDIKNPRRGQLAESVIKTTANSYNIPVLQPEKALELVEQLAPYTPVLGILVSYGKIIPQTVLDLFPLGIINVHPSALPKLRGPSPIEQALLDNYSQTAISIIKLTAAMDAGPVFTQEAIGITPGTTKPDLYSLLSQHGAQSLMANLPAILDGSLQPTPQNEAEATYTQLLQKSDGQIDWTKPADRIEREVRAYLGWPGSSTQLFGVEVTIIQSHVEPSATNSPGHIIYDKDNLKVYCGQDILIIDHLKPAGRSLMSGAEFARGYAAKL